MVWIIGASDIAIEYSKILVDLGYQFLVIGRSEKSASLFEEKTGIRPFTGGIEKFLLTEPETPNAAIIAVNVEALSKTSLLLLKYGVKRLLVEKPGFCSPEELYPVYNQALNSQAEVYYAYNRRFFASTLLARKLIDEDGGVVSFNFEFTEWAHVIGKLNKSDVSLQNWFYANSSHIIDLAFYLGGKPSKLSSFISGELPWHKPTTFVGAGVTDNGALFSYQANWQAPGRWGIELMTNKHRLIFRPVETLQVQKLGSIAIENIELDDHLDKTYKSGFFLEVKKFLSHDIEGLCTITEQMYDLNNIYNIIKGLS